MPSRIVAVAIDCLDADRVAEFWCTALTITSVERWRDAEGKQYVELALGTQTDTVGTVLLFQPVADRKEVKNRVHLDIAPEAGNQSGEILRLRAAGAVVINDAPDNPWVVMADPEGNEFCVLPPRP